MTIRDFANFVRQDWNDKIKTMQDEGLIVQNEDSIHTYYLPITIGRLGSTALLPDADGIRYHFDSKPDSIFFYGSGVMAMGGPTIHLDRSEETAAKLNELSDQITSRLIDDEFLNKLKELQPTLSDQLEIRNSNGDYRYTDLVFAIGAHNDHAEAYLVHHPVHCNDADDLFDDIFNFDQKKLDLD